MRDSLEGLLIYEARRIRRVKINIVSQAQVSYPAETQLHLSFVLVQDGVPRSIDGHILANVGQLCSANPMDRARRSTHFHISQRLQYLQRFVQVLDTKIRTSVDDIAFHVVCDETSRVRC